MLLDTQLLSRVFNFWPSFLLHGWPMGDCGYEKAFKNYRASYWYLVVLLFQLPITEEQTTSNLKQWFLILHSSLGWLGSAGWVFCSLWLGITHIVAYSWGLCRRWNVKMDIFPCLADVWLLAGELPFFPLYLASHSAGPLSIWAFYLDSRQAQISLHGCWLKTS